MTNEQQMEAIHHCIFEEYKKLRPSLKVESYDVCVVKNDKKRIYEAWLESDQINTADKRIVIPMKNFGDALSEKMEVTIREAVGVWCRS